MLTKLLKYEVRTTARMLLPLYAGTVLAWGVARAFAPLSGRLHLGSTLLFIVQALLLFVYWLTMLATGLMTVFVNIRQFYRLLGEDGYFLIPLPASAAQHLAAKLICGTGWTVVYCLFVSLLNRQTTGSASAADGGIVGVGETTMYYYFAGKPISQGAERLLNAGLLGLAVLVILCAYLCVYLCIIIGGRWPRRRALASVLVYFGLSLAWQAALITALVALFNNEHSAIAIVNWLEHFVDEAQRVDAIVPMLWVIVGLAAAALAVAGGVLWAVDHHLVSKRLNIM